MTLGVACKKSNDVADAKPELKVEKLQINDGVEHDPNSLYCNCSDCRGQHVPPIKPPVQ